MISDEEYAKKVKRLLILCIAGAILGVIGILLAEAGEFESLKMIMAGVDAVIFLILLVLTYILSKNKKMAGPVLGIILGAWDIVHLSVYVIIIGIYIIINCSAICKDISAFNKNKKSQEE